MGGDKEKGGGKKQNGSCVGAGWWCYCSPWTQLCQWEEVTRKGEEWEVTRSKMGGDKEKGGREEAEWEPPPALFYLPFFFLTFLSGREWQ